MRGRWQAIHQRWRTRIANEIVDRFEGDTRGCPQEMAATLAELASDYLHWATSWMTLLSAQANTGLVFDAIADYFSPPEKE